MNQLTVENVERIESMEEPQFGELSDAQLALVGGGIADIIGV